jgi:NAD(P)-dependent dehydrogenase (short-subunit alcohol dehydrogenase family)
VQSFGIAFEPENTMFICEETHYILRVAHAVLFLAAPESSYLNGAIIPVDGGWLAGYSRDF